MMFYIFLPSLGECGRLDTDNVSPEIENLIILSTSLHSTLAGAHQIHNQQDSLSTVYHPGLSSPQTRLEGDYSIWEFPG